MLAAICGAKPAIPVQWVLGGGVWWETFCGNKNTKRVMQNKVLKGYNRQAQLTEKTLINR